MQEMFEHWAKIGGRLDGHINEGRSSIYLCLDASGPRAYDGCRCMLISWHTSRKAVSRALVRTSLLMEAASKAGTKAGTP